MSRLIDADALRDELFVDYFDSDDWGFISRHIDDAPTVDAVERKRGRWIEAKYPLFTCSECVATYQDIGYGYNFCPNCGEEKRNERAD